MARQSEISSTERLLNLIRRKSDDKDSKSDTKELAKPASPKLRVVKKKLSSRKAFTLGIDFGGDSVRIVGITYGADKKPVMSHYVRVPYQNGITLDSPRFPAFLKSVIHDLIGNRQRVDIWCTIPATHVETRFLKIPKVPKKQLFNTVFWSHKKESNVDEKGSIFDFEVIGDTVEDGIPKTDVISYTAPKHEIDRIKKIFRKTGYPLVGVSIVPFALQNLFRTGWTDPAGNNVCTLFIGADWSRIAIFCNKNLILCRDVKAGLQSMIDAVAEQLESQYPEFASPSADDKELALIGPEDQKDAHLMKTAGAVLEGYINGDFSKISDEVGIDFDLDEVFRMISPALDRVVRQVERTLDHYYLNYGNERVSSVFISGPICSHERLVSHISDQIGIGVKYIDPFDTELPGAVDVSSPDSSHERGDFVPAIGIALSLNLHTPNFIYTHKEKEKAEKIQQFNRGIFSVSIVIMMICIGFFAYQNNQLDQKKKAAVKLQRQLEGYIPLVDQNMILQLATHSFTERQSVDAFAEKYKGMAIITEIVKVTPSNISLAGLEIHLGGIAKEGKKEEPPKENLGSLLQGLPLEKSVLMEGVMFGDRLNFEAALAGYMVKIEGSPLFGRPVVVDKSIEVVDEQEVLKFTAQVEII